MNHVSSTEMDPYSGGSIPGLLDEGRQKPSCGRAIILAGLAQAPTGAAERDGGPDENDPGHAKPNAICHSLIHCTAPALFSSSQS
jgi:hypothetical protein